MWDLGVSLGLGLGLGLGVDNFFTAEFWELGAEGRRVFISSLAVVC